RALLRRLIARLDPDGAHRRHTTARTTREVSYRPLPDGMGSIWARLSAVDTEAVWQTLCRLAKALGPDDPRTMDQRRADLLVDLCPGRLTLTDTTAVTEQVTAALAHLRDSYNPGADTDGTAAARATTEDAGASGTQTGPAVAQADAAGPATARQASTDPTSADPAEAAGGSGESPPPEPRPGGETANPLGEAALAVSEAQLAAAVEAAVEAVLTHRPDPQAVGRGKPLIQVVVGYDTLTGASDTPAELVGYGPIPAGLAREAAADGVWKRLITDPLSGALLDHGRTLYRPPAALRDFVVARDQTCRFPTCNRRALDGDLDHHQRAADRGPTYERNLHGLCRHHHTLKEHEDWQVLAHPDGSLTWITPTGHRYLSKPYDYRPFTTAPDAEPIVPDPEAAAEFAARAQRDADTDTDQPGDTPPTPPTAPPGGWTLASMRGDLIPADLDDPAPF
ncbi:HNH endonuclease, partial [Pseudonocardia halophobica]